MLFEKNVRKMPYQIYRLPPMPKGHWLWGNTYDMDKAIEQFREWQKKYGDIYRLNIAGLKVIMVC